MKLNVDVFSKYYSNTCPTCGKSNVCTEYYRDSTKRWCVHCNVVFSDEILKRNSVTNNNKIENILFAVVSYRFEGFDKIPKTEKVFDNFYDAQIYKRALLREQWIYTLSNNKFSEDFYYFIPKLEKAIGKSIKNTDPVEIVDDLIYFCDNFLFSHEMNYKYERSRFNLAEIHLIEDLSPNSELDRYLIFEENFGDNGWGAVRQRQLNNGIPLLITANKEYKDRQLYEFNLTLFKQKVLNKSFHNDLVCNFYLIGDKDQKWYKFENDTIKLSDLMKENDFSLEDTYTSLDKMKSLIEQLSELKFVNFAGAYSFKIE